MRIETVRFVGGAAILVGCVIAEWRQKKEEGATDRERLLLLAVQALHLATELVE